MKTKRRWMAWVLEESAKPQPSMPWTRSKHAGTVSPPGAARA